MTPSPVPPQHRPPSSASSAASSRPSTASPPTAKLTAPPGGSRASTSPTPRLPTSGTPMSRTTVLPSSRIPLPPSRIPSRVQSRIQVARAQQKQQRALGAACVAVLIADAGSRSRVAAAGTARLLPLTAHTGLLCLLPVLSRPQERRCSGPAHAARGSPSAHPRCVRAPGHHQVLPRGLRRRCSSGRGRRRACSDRARCGGCCACSVQRQHGAGIV